MSIKKLLGMCLLSVCTFLGVIAFVKRDNAKPLAEEKRVDEQKEAVAVNPPPAITLREVVEEDGACWGSVHDAIGSEEVDHIERFFTTKEDQFSIVQTVRYKSRVPWLKGKQAWVADYASYYKTSRHFIARSLNRGKDYLTQKVGIGDTFTVLRPDKKIQFYLVVDLSRCKMWFYYHDLSANEKVLIKTYKVGLGRLDLDAKSGTLTPAGRYWLGDKIASYKPGVVGYFQGEEVEMIRIFGTRWIPFSDKIGELKGYGLHGVPWLYDSEAKTYAEDQTIAMGGYTSDGCIRLTREDIEEIYAIVVTRPAMMEIVTDFQKATLPKVSCEEAVAIEEGRGPC